MSLCIAVGTAAVAGDGATAPAAEQRLITGLRQCAAGDVVAVKVDQMAIVAGRCTTLNRYAVGIVAGRAGNAAIYHMTGMFVDAGV